MVLNYALRADIYMVVFAEVLSLFIGVFGAELLLGVLLILFVFFLRGNVLFRVEVVKNREVLY